MISVVAAFLIRDDKILIAKRSHGVEINKWEFPGGKINDGETAEQALKRELQEELNVEAEVMEKLHEVEHSYPERKISMSLYKCNFISGSIKLSAHFRHKWISFNEIDNYNMPPADLELVKYLKTIYK